MIRSFRDATTKALFNDEDAPRFRAIERVARRKLLYLHQAKRLEDLRVPARQSARSATGRPQGGIQHPHQRPVADLLSLEGRRCS